MEKYQYSKAEFEFIENTSVPMAVYQFVDRRVVTLALSRGFMELFGLDDRAEAYDLMDNDMYRDAHPEDVARVADAAVDFATNGGVYEAIYRNRSPKDDHYRVIHALGRHEFTKTGERIAVVWYTDEGEFDASVDTHLSQLNRTLTDALHRESIMHENTYDSLTGLPNMTYFFELSESGRDAIMAKGGKPAMVYFDINGMTGFNNKYGFAGGDIFLKAFADLLVKYFSKENCGRFGQDHFIAYADDNTLKEELENFFEELKTINGGKTLTVRVGIFLKIPGVTIDAGAACDRAKAAADSITNTLESGYRYFDEEMQAEIDHRQYIIDNLDRAIEEKWIKVYYQPIVRAANGRVCDEEALARWIDPEKGLLPPDEFIPILENAHLTYKLDLYVVEEILRKIRASEDEDLYIVPQSVNLSRYDFESCDIVEEIRSRVEAAGISPEKLTIEITESVIGSDYDYMKAQVERFHELGFNVWMDDFGSDYSSLDYLQSIPFDLIKLDRRFMQQFYDSDKSRIIITELIRMAMNLGLETVTEGVEHEDQVEFLREIGCTKLQGFYYSKPIAPEEIFERYRTGKAIGFENPEESGYYEAIGRLNLYDISGVERADAGFGEYFDTIPAAIVEYRDPYYDVIRANKSFKEFEDKQHPEPTRAIRDAMRKCSEDGKDRVIEEELPNGTSLHTYLKCIAVNPVTGIAAIAITIFASIGKKDNTPGTTSAAVARALSADYFDLYYINIETEDFIQYNTDSTTGEIAAQRYGTDFFEEARKDSLDYLYKQDQKDFLNAFTKEHVLDSLERQGAFTTRYRLVRDGEPFYVAMKITRIGDDNSHVIMGVSNVDTEMKHKAELEKIREERSTYARIKALMGDYLSFYTVDPVTDNYTEYSEAPEYRELGFERQGTDFFRTARREAVRTVYNQDLEHFLSRFTKEIILDNIKESGLYSLRYRLMMNGEPRYVSLRAAMTGEKGSEELIIGINDIDARMKSEYEISNRSEKMRSMPQESDMSNETLFQMLVDNMGKPAAVLSVEKTGDGGYGEIRIVRANQAYKESMGEGYRDDMLYYELVPRDIKFEDYCFNAAILGKRMHSYVETKQLNAWTDLEILPLNSSDEGHGYCIFLFEFTKGPEAERMSNVSIATASLVIEACIKLIGARNFRESVNRVIEDVRAMADAVSCRIMLVNHDKEEVVNYSVARKEGEDLVGIPVEDVLPYRVVRTWDAMIDESNVVIIKDERDMELLEQKNPVWAESLRMYRVDSLVFIPLYQNKTIFGYMYIVNFDTTKVVEIKEVLELLSFFLGSEISNNLLMERMDMLVRTDSLTGVNNRYAMIQKIAGLSEKNFGIISIDLNALKRINDTKGHDEGDSALIQAAEVISKVFYRDDIFRTGGDEFLVISEDIRENVFERKLERLRKDADKNIDVSLAIGSCWSDGSISASDALRIADDNMYDDKKQFYKAHPELKVR